MNLTESERAENREAISRMSLPQKLGYVFEYYKFPLVLILIVCVALGSVIYYRVSWKEPVLYVAYANISVGSGLDSELGEAFIRACGIDPRRSEVRVYRNLYLSQDASVQNHEYAYASRLKLMAAVTNGQLDVVLMNREAYDLLSAGGYLLPLKELLSGKPGLLSRVEDRLTENTVILRDNEIEHLLDENTPYQALSEKAINGILISRFPRLESAGFSGDVYLGVIGNSSRPEAVVQYIDYLTEETERGAE